MTAPCDPPAERAGTLEHHAAASGRGTWVLRDPQGGPMRFWPDDLTRDDVGALLLETGLLLKPDDTVWRI